MKRTLLILAIALFITNDLLAVKTSGIEADRVTLHNFSTSTFDASGMKLTINNQWFAFSALTLISGNLNCPAGSDIVLGGFTVPLTGGSVALWYSSVDECNPSAFDMACFVQYGFAGNAFEALAVTANLWIAGAFVHGGPPLTRDTDWSSDGPQHWGGTNLSIHEKPLLESIEIGPVPFSNRLTIYAENYSLDYNLEMFNVLGKVNFKRIAVKEKELIINTELLQQGVYFIRISDGSNNSLTRRIVKNE